MTDKILGVFDVNNLPKNIEEALPLIKNIGLKVQEMAPGHVSLKLPLIGNGNYIGMMYAGVLFTLGEVLGNALFSSCFDGTKYVPVIRRMEINYKRPAITDVTVTVTMEQEQVDRIRSELDKMGKSSYVLECEIKDTGNQIVTETKAEYQIRACV